MFDILPAAYTFQPGMCNGRLQPADSRMIGAWPQLHCSPAPAAATPCCCHHNTRLQRMQQMHMCSRGCSYGSGPSSPPSDPGYTGQPLLPSTSCRRFLAIQLARPGHALPSCGGRQTLAIRVSGHRAVHQGKGHPPAATAEGEVLASAGIVSAATGRVLY